jgi:aquaporin Z
VGRDSRRPGQPARRATAWRAWPLWCAELFGTALLIGGGCSFVILDFGASSPILALVPDAGARRALTGFLFGAVGALLAVSRVGKISGAHLNPVVTLAFWLEGRMAAGVAVGYTLAQLVGGVIGAVPLRLWRAMGASTSYAATVPGPAGPWVAALGEAGATFCLIAGLLVFLGHARLRRFTPLLFPFLYALLVWVEAPLSGTSTNTARTIGPGLVSGQLQGWWVYVLGPVVGALAGVAARKALPWTRYLEADVAKVFHFGHDAHGIFAERSAHARRAQPRLR